MKVAKNPVFLQIDGLAFRQMERALEEGRLPYCRKLKDRDYQLKSFYTGLPSTTPAVQAELFFGIRGAVPAFEFYDRRAKVRRLMRRRKDIAAVVKLLPESTDPLLQGGSVYSSIYTGGAVEMHLIPEAFPEIRSNLRRFYELNYRSLLGLARILGRLLLNFPMEVLRSLVEAMQGILQGESVRQELTLIGARLSIKIVAREVIHEGIIDDIRRGLPAIQANLLAFDECAHRRGPHSTFAHRSLRSIDNMIASLDRFIRRKAPNYTLVIYSDHGQEEVIPYRRQTGSSFEKAVKGVWTAYKEGSVGQPIVCAKGPLGHIYLPGESTEKERRDLAQRVASIQPGVGVLYCDEAGKARFADKDSDQALADALALILSSDHPFYQQVGEDLEMLATHVDAGDLVALGWHPGKTPTSFPDENGAHAGPGMEETEAFLFAPPQWIPDQAKFRPVDLYRHWTGLRSSTNAEKVSSS